MPQPMINQSRTNFNNNYANLINSFFTDLSRPQINVPQVKNQVGVGFLEQKFENQMAKKIAFEV